MVNKKRLLIIILMLLITVIGGTFAWFSYVSRKSALVLTIGDINDASITIQNYQIKEKMTPVNAYTSGVYSQIKITNNNNFKTHYKIILKINQLDQVLIDNGLKYTLAKSDIEDGVYEEFITFPFGDFAGDYTAGSEYECLSDLISPGQSKYWRIYFWLDSSVGNQTEVQNHTLNLELTGKLELPPAYAVYSEDNNSLNFYRPNEAIQVGDTYNGLTATAVWTGFEDATYNVVSKAPWHQYSENITGVGVIDKIYPINTNYWFYGMTNCNSFDLTNLDTSNVTNMAYMFYEAGANAPIFAMLGLDNWDTSNVTNMSYMFGHAGEYATDGWGISSLSNWDTSNVTNMSHMFYNAGSSSPYPWTVGDLSNWDTSNVINMSGMFYISEEYGENISNWSVGNLSNWDVSNVTDMSSMFRNAGGETTTWDVGNLSNWDVSNVTDMSHMFYYAGHNATAFNLNLSNWDVSNVTTMYSMFSQAGKLASTWNVGNLDNWDVSNVTTMFSMFDHAATAATTWNIGTLVNWNTSKVTSMGAMFFGVLNNSTADFVLDLTGWDTSKVTNMRYMFANTGDQTAGGSKTAHWNVGMLDNWDTSSVLDMSYMFYYAAYDTYNVMIGDLSDWDTSSVIKMNSMFHNAAYTYIGNAGGVGFLDLSSWDVSNVTSHTNFVSSTNPITISGGEPDWPWT